MQAVNDPQPYPDPSGQPAGTAPVSTTSSPVVCGTAPVASASTFVPIAKPSKVVGPGVRAQVSVNTASQVSVSPTLIYRASGKSHSIALAQTSFQTNSYKKLRLALPAGLRSALPLGTAARLSLRISAVPNGSPACSAPSITTHVLDVKVVEVITQAVGH